MDESAFSRKKDSSKQRGNAAKERLFSELSGTADQVVLPEIGGAASSKRKKGAALNKRISVVELEEVASPRTETLPGVCMCPYSELCITTRFLQWRKAHLFTLVAGRIRLKTAAEKLQRRLRRFGAETPPQPKSPVRAPFRNLIFDQVVRA
jgi:hypothetical protein